MSNKESITAVLADEQLSVGTFFKSNAPIIAESLGHTPLDFLLIDRQHGSPDFETVESIIRAADLNDLPTLVRMPKENTDLMNNVLDLGAHGIVVPQVHTAAEVLDIAEDLRYADKRSFAMSTRAGAFGNRDMEEYIEWVDQELAIVPQIESREGAQNLEEIAELDDVTAIMIGPADLALSHDLPLSGERVGKLVADLVERAQPLDCGLGMYVDSSEGVDTYRDRAQFVLYASDVGVLSARFNQILRN